MLLQTECVQYFKGNKAFCRLFVKLKEKFSSLGHVGGNVILNSLTLEEKEAIGGLLRKDFSKQKSASVSMLSIQNALDHSKFRGVLLPDILNEYFEQAIVPNKDIKQRYLHNRTAYFERIIEKYKGTSASEWLAAVMKSKSNAFPIIMALYERNSVSVLQAVENVCHAINHLPSMRGSKRRLPVFATEMTKDPHAFDVVSPCGKIFLHALTFAFKVEFPNSAEKRATLYYMGGILLDEVSSFVLCKGLQAYTNNGVHLGWEGFYHANEAMIVTLANMGAVTRVASAQQKIFVVENPAVFAAILDKTEGHAISLVCTNGQLKIAALVLLDLLVQGGSVLYYSGDFDPEGLQIANKLANRYREKCKLWRFSKEDYLSAISERPLDDKRIKKLETISHVELLEVSQEITKLKFAGYQEALMNELIMDILHNGEGAY
ncbi:MAG: TIGR02679 family protein [Hyphomonadaceae bacterium]|nr:TIGR02679 family protein [Clostridia bacterium]